MDCLSFFTATDVLCEIIQWMGHNCRPPVEPAGHVDFMILPSYVLLNVGKKPRKLWDGKMGQ